MKEDFAWFREHYAEFQRQYGNAFLAIKDKKILGVYHSFAEGIYETSKTEEAGTFIVQECDPQRIAYQVYIASMNF